MEPMLLENYKYGQVPQSIKNMLRFFEKHNLPTDKNDLVVGLLYLLMVETGFVHKECTETVQDCDFNYQRLLRHSRALPEAWKTSNSYQLDFILSSAPDMICTIICITVSDDLLINCSIKGVGQYSLLVDPLVYYISSNVKLGTCMFQNLNHLAYFFKNSIAFPAKVAIVSVTGGICACFQHLPHELLVKIMSYLSISDVMKLARTCCYLCQAAQDSSLWVKLLDYDFRKKNIFKTYEELKFLYEIKYARELREIWKTLVRKSGP